MIVAKQVERAVHHQVGRMLFQRHAFLFSLILADAVSQDDIAKQQFHFENVCTPQIELICHGEG